MRKWLLALLALMIVTPALAQIMQVRPIQRPNAVPEVQQIQQAPADLSVDLLTVEQAREQIAQLRREKREMNARLTEAIATIDEMTKRGGSLVRAYCEGDSLSRNTAGATEDCGAYKCGDVAGLCHKSCTTSDHGSTGRSCAYNECLTLAEVQARAN